MIDLGSVAIEWLAAGVVLAIAGGLVKFAGWTFLLAGYDETSPVPDDVVADVAGNTILRIGIAVTAFGALTLVWDVPSYLPLALGGLVLLAVLRLVYRLNTYAPQATA